MKRRITRLTCLTFLIFFCLTAEALDLRCVVQATLHTNPDLLQVIHNFEATNEQVMQAQSGYYPSVDVRALFGREKTRNSNTFQRSVTLWRKELGITLQEMLFDGYATRNEELRTMAKTDADAYRVYAESEDIALAAIESYLNILRDKELIAAAEKNVAVHKELAYKIGRRSAVGVGRVSDTSQAKARLALAESALIDSIREYNEDQILFEKITGLCPDCLEPPPIPTELPQNECYALKLAVCYHPTLKVALAEIEAARAAHRGAFAPDFPRIDLLIAANNNRNIAGIPQPDENQGAFVRLQWNLFRGGRDYARQRETAFQVKAAVDVRDKTYRDVIERMSLSWNALLISTEQTPFLLTHMVESGKTAVAFGKLFMVGRTSLFDLLDSQRESFIATQNFINNKYVEMIARYRILNGIGEVNCFLGIPLSRHACPCYKTNEKAGTLYGPIELDYDKLCGGCCKPPKGVVQK